MKCCYNLQAKTLYFMRRSHIGARPIALPAEVKCTLLPTQNATDTRGLRVQGPLGVQDVVLPQGISPLLRSISLGASGGIVETSAQQLILQCHDPQSSTQRSNWGLTAARLANIVQGVHQGFVVPVRLVGVGYRASLEEVAESIGPKTLEKQTLVLRLGYPRPIRLTLPSTMRCHVLSATDIELRGQDKQELGQFAARLRRLRPPEPYNGKGVFVGQETVRRKEVKKK
jgi:large subunit ribosomal protein L6